MRLNLLLTSRHAWLMHKVVKAAEAASHITTCILVLIILGLAASTRHLVHVEWIDPLSEHVLSCRVSLISSGARMSGLTDVTLFAFLAAWSSWPTELRSLHVWAVAQLALLVLEVCIVGRVGPRREVIVVAYDVVVWRGRSRDTQIRLILSIWHATCHSEALRANLCRVKACVDAELASVASHWVANLSWLHALVYLLLCVDAVRVSIVHALGL